jgi:hypothetical protein
MKDIRGAEKHEFKNKPSSKTYIDPNKIDPKYFEQAKRMLK